MMTHTDDFDAPDRLPLRFPQGVRVAFSFLADSGFKEIEAKPTIVRYQNGGIEVDVYHGRQSYEIGGGVTISGIRYAISEILRVNDPETAKHYRNAVATTPEAVAAGLEELSALMQRHCAGALRGDSVFISMLAEQRKRWASDYALDVLVDQLRPQADDAFRKGQYLKAAELYGRIRERLSPAEAKKLTLAQARSGIDPGQAAGTNKSR